MTQPKTIAEARARIAACSFPDCTFCVEASDFIVTRTTLDVFTQVDAAVRGHASMHAPSGHNGVVGMIQASLRKLATKLTRKCPACGGAGCYTTSGGIPTGDCISCGGTGETNDGPTPLPCSLKEPHSSGPCADPECVLR